MMESWTVTGEMGRMSPNYTASTSDHLLIDSHSSLCPKMSRYKMVSVTLTLTVSVFLTVVSISGSHTVKTVTSVSVFVSRQDGTEEVVRPCHDRTITDASKQASKDHDPVATLMSSQYSDLQQHLPSVIVIGARKAGTGALLRFISLHPWVATSKSEPHFFDRFYRQGLDWYQSKMPQSLSYQVTVEKTPNYFVDRNVPERVYNFNSSIKLILIVRNPIDRAVSDYVQLKFKFYKHNTSETYGTFEERAINRFTGEINKSYDPIKRSMYSSHLDRWMTYFNRSQLLIIDGENLRIKPWEEISKVERFLSLPQKIEQGHFVYNKTKGFYCVKTAGDVTTTATARDTRRWSESCLGNTKGREHPKLSEEVRKTIRNFFTPFNERFFKIIGERFDWKR